MSSTRCDPLAFTAGEIDRLLDIEAGSFPAPWTLADFQLLSQDEHSLNLGLWHDEVLVGYLVGLIEGERASDRKTLHLASLAVEPEWRRQGCAKRLLQRALQQAHERGCTTCRLEVRQTNDVALHLYQRFGFAVNGVRRRFYTKPVEDAWLLSCDLPVEPLRRT